MLHLVLEARLGTGRLGEQRPGRDGV